jgi:hypothetical protein
MSLVSNRGSGAGQGMSWSAAVADRNAQGLMKGGGVEGIVKRSSKRNV